MTGVEAPFPGLRPFEQREGEIFFGRHNEVSAMLSRLESQRLLTVIGTSGCGKSSLVRAGLLPALEEGFLLGGGPYWRFAILRPGNQPHRNLALALCSAVPELQTRPNTAEFIEADLLSGEHALLKLIGGLSLDPGTCLLVLVDQFEELFLFGAGKNPETDSGTEVYERRTEANSFVDLLLRTVKGQIIAPNSLESSASSKIKWQCPVFVVSTMRSEFIGRCDMFLGLPEAITASQFLTPRMTREQIKDAIERPLELFASHAEPSLVNRLLNDVGTEPDSLPLLQHCLLRTWQTALGRRVSPSTDNHGLELTMADYDKAGTFIKALENHAEEAYYELGSDPKDGKRLHREAELLFRLLSRKTSEGIIVRNPITIREAAVTAQVSANDVFRVVKVFGQEGRNFVSVSPNNRKPDLGSTVDISHESLFRNWERLQQWTKVEAGSVEDFSWVMEGAKRWENKGGSLPESTLKGVLASLIIKSAERWKSQGGSPTASKPKHALASYVIEATERWAKRGSLLTGSNLRDAIAWEREQNPSPAWCARYGGDFELMRCFLQKSTRADRTKKVLILVGAIALSASLIVPYVQWRTEAIRSEAAKVGASQELLRIAYNYLDNRSDPRRNVLSLTSASQAIAQSRANFGAVKLACNLMLGKRWCPPLTPPLRYAETDFLTATVVHEGNQDHIFAVTSDGWLVRFTGTDTKPDSVMRISHPRLIGASFSHDALELIVVQVSGNDNAHAYLWSRRGLTYVQANEFPIEDYSSFNNLTWSGDDRLFIFLPLKFQQPSVCRAFRLDGNAQVPIDHPFGDLPLTRVAFSRTDLVATLTGEKLRLWKWTGDSFQPADSTWINGLTLPDQFRPNSVAFGPGPQYLTLSGNDPKGSSPIRLTIVNIEDKSFRDLPASISRAGMLSTIFQPNSSSLVAIPIYRAVILGDIGALNFQTPDIEPMCFQGIFATAVFSQDGAQLLTLSGEEWPRYTWIQLWDVSLRRKPTPHPSFDPNGNPAPVWLPELARSISGNVGATGSENASFATMNQVSQEFTGSQNGSANYQDVWHSFFDEQ
jgi:hypothetical protein